MRHLRDEKNMGNACVKPSKKVTLVMVGLDNAGKTTAAKGLIGESPVDVAPTLGFSSFELKRDNFDVTLYDLGGSRTIRGIWRNYLAEAFGFVFVVDASDQDRVMEAREVLHDLLKTSTVSGKPFLILANKQDVEGALDDVELVALLELESLVNEKRCPTRVEICSALKPDTRVRSGFKWLLTTIGLDYDNLRERVERDVAVQRKIEAEDLCERTKRVARLRREREAQEETTLQTEAMSNGTDFVNDSSGDPFKPIATIAKELEQRTSAQLPAEPNDGSTMETPVEVPKTKVIRVASADIEDSPPRKTTDQEEQEESETRDAIVTFQNTLAELAVHDDDVVALASPISNVEEDKQSPSKVSSSMMGSDNQLIELEKTTKSRKRKIFWRNNKTCPSLNKGHMTATLPPLALKASGPWTSTTSTPTTDERSESRHSTPNGFLKLSWSLAEELESIESNRLAQVS